MKKRLMAITFAALMATSMMGSTVFAATDGGSVAGKTSLADADFEEITEIVSGAKAQKRK